MCVSIVTILYPLPINDHMHLLTFFIYLVQWYPDELQHHCPNVPIILVGTKLDLRDDKEQESRADGALSMEKGFKMQRKIDNIVKYMECSSLTRQGVNEVFEEAARIALKYKERNTPQQRCVLL